ncbi:MAG: hypothetical protein ACM3U2_18320, partial [Deltaproteobacteria bacterium]
LEAIRAIEDPTPQMLYIELDAQRRLADATIQYYRALVEYEIAVKNVHFEKGSILEYNGIYLAELPSPGKAYEDAYEKIKLRTHAARWAADGASTRVVSEGLVPQAYAPASPPPTVPRPAAGANSDEAPPPPPEPGPQARKTPSAPRDAAGGDAERKIAPTSFRAKRPSHPTPPHETAEIPILDDDLAGGDEQ